MKLHVREEGSGTPVIILHGLFGSGDNWQSVARGLGSGYRFCMLDLANHGLSPHADSLSFESMAGDIIETADELGLDQFCLLGHSMGGKVAMKVALDQPSRVEKLVVADIAPKPYPPKHRAIIDALRETEAASPESRQEADRIMEQWIPNRMVRAFLLKNLVPRSSEEAGQRAAAGLTPPAAESQYVWRLGLEALERSYETLIGWPETADTFEGPTLFVGGEQSDYFSRDDEPRVREYFPEARIEIIPNAGHWLHSDQREKFIETVRSFLTNE